MEKVARKIVAFAFSRIRDVPDPGRVTPLADSAIP
jgi:hypothetical protein